ncbi:response regulator [Nitrosopumilus sp.]|uniref:response regulator n=1 Tax=Nitrosopumilus sp. TaxID=2024843 RepID=UPI00247CA5C8|nr:response regulator [Nitrosopumilus sp.]MCV0410510.1 response regulator [Nitrosopumilus sp.]
MNNKSLRILVVEDEEALAEYYKTVLESEGHKVFVARNGKEEFEIYEKEIRSHPFGKLPFDLIVSDNSMPEMTGIEAGQKILELEPAQKFFFVTGEEQSILDSFNVDGKNIDVEQKPFKTEKFLNKVEILTQN